MSTSTPITEFYSTTSDKEIAHLLTYAKKTKLLAEIPRQLRMISYCGFCCIVIQKSGTRSKWTQE